MGLFDFLKKKPEPEPEAPAPFLEIYTAMRVEVSDGEGQLFFVAKLLNIQENHGELRPFAVLTAPPESEEALPVKLRGYSDRERKAVYLEGAIRPMDGGFWKVENLTLIKISNDRAFFRLSTNITATVMPMTGKFNVTEDHCRLLNIGVGGACISSNTPYQRGDRLFLNVQLHPDRDPSLLLGQVVRVQKVVGKEKTWYECGCKFLEMTESQQERFTQLLFELQRKRGQF